MKRSNKGGAAWLLILLAVCGAILLAAALGMFLLRYRAMEQELNRMLIASMNAHVQEDGARVQDLIGSTEAVLVSAVQKVEEDGRAPDKSWVGPMLETKNLGGGQFELKYLDRGDLVRARWKDETRQTAEQLMSGTRAISDVIFDSEYEESYILIAFPLEWEGKVEGAVQAHLNASLLTQQGQYSALFETVHCAVADSEGCIVYGSIPESVGTNLMDMSSQNGITQKEVEEFRTSYLGDENGFFYYEADGGRNYMAWAPITYAGWRVVQFSQSPNVQIEQTSVVQAGLTLASLAVCAILAVMIWRQRARMAAEKLRYDALSQFQDTLIFEYDCHADSLEFTSNALETLDLTNARLERVTDENRSFPIFHPDDIDTVRRIFREAKNMLPDQVDHDRIRLRKRDGDYSWYRSQYKAVFDTSGQVVQVLGTLTDISMQIDREQELRNQAQRDPLTGLYNRAGVKLINARLEQISRGVLFMMDLDDFKYINDTYGHAAGDRVLTEVARVLEETFRTDDIVARVGGDEFIAFLSGSDSRTTAEQKAQELLEHVQRLKIEGIDIQTSVSIGAASAPTCGRTYEALSTAADEVMYRVKKSGKGGFMLR